MADEEAEIHTIAGNIVLSIAARLLMCSPQWLLLPPGRDQIRLRLDVPKADKRERIARLRGSIRGARAP